MLARLRPTFVVPLEEINAQKHIGKHMPEMVIDGKLVRGAFVLSPSGGVTSSIVAEVMERAITWRWKDRPANQWAIITTDAVGTHISPAFLKWCRANKICLILRCPHSSSKMQPEGTKFSIARPFQL